MQSIFHSVALPILLKILFKFEAILYITIFVSEVLRSCIKPWSSPWIVCSQKHIGSAMHATRSSWPRNERYISYRNGFSTRFSIHDSPCSEWKTRPWKFVKTCREAPWSPGGYFQKNWVVVCGPLSKTLTVFVTKICDRFFLPFLWPDQKFDTLFMTLVHSCRKHKFVKGFCCWPYLTCVAGVKRRRRRQSRHGRRRAWWRSSCF